MSKKEEKKHDELVNVEHALTSTEAFIEKYQKQILMGVGAIVLVVLVALSFRNFYLQPREIAAENEMYKSQAFFAKDSFRLALNGAGAESIGFKAISSDYGITNSGKLAAAYAGICYYKLGQYQDAVKYLSQFDGKDTYFTTSVIGLTGDCYVELGDNSKALSYFEKAEKLYTTIKEKYPKSAEAADIDKYLARVQK